LWVLVVMTTVLAKVDQLIEATDPSKHMMYKSRAKDAVIPAQMTAIVVDAESKKLTPSTVATPKLRPREVIIKIEATAVNRADLLQAAGRYPPPKGESEIIGLECSGTIVDYSDDCQIAGQSKAFDIGSRVMALLPGGGYAQYVNVHETHLIPVPDDISFETAAAIPEAFLTAFQLLFWYGKPQNMSLKHPIDSEQKQDESTGGQSTDSSDGDVVLIHAGGSGVGTTLIQYCREYGLNAFLTAGSKEKIEFGIKLGAKGGANYKEEQFDEKLMAMFSGGANIVLDCVGQSHWFKNINAIAVDGRLVSYGFLSGAQVKPQDENNPAFNLAPILRKRISVIGTTLRTRSNEYKAELIRDFVTRIVEPLIATKRIEPIVSKVFEVKDAQSAHEFVAGNKNIGKVVLTWDGNQCKL